MMFRVSAGVLGWDKEAIGHAAEWYKRVVMLMSHSTFPHIKKAHWFTSRESERNMMECFRRASEQNNVLLYITG